MTGVVLCLHSAVSLCIRNKALIPLLQSNGEHWAESRIWFVENTFCKKRFIKLSPL